MSTPYDQIENELNAVCAILNAPMHHSVLPSRQWHVVFVELFSQYGINAREYKIVRKMVQFDYNAYMPEIDNLLDDHGLERRNTRISGVSGDDIISMAHVIVEIMIVFSDDSLNGNLFQSIGAMD